MRIERGLTQQAGQLPRGQMVKEMNLRKPRKQALSDPRESEGRMGTYGVI